MKILVKYKDNEFSLNLDYFNIIYGGNGSGKTKLFNLLSDGFNAKLKNDFSGNGEKIEKNQYFVYLIEETDNFSDEMKLGTKSVIWKDIERRIEDYMDEEIESLKNEIENLIKHKLLYKFEYLDEIDLNFELNLSDVIVKNIEFKHNQNNYLSFSKLRLLKIKTILSKVHEPNAIVLIDHFDLGLSISERNNLIEYLKSIAEKNKIRIIVFTSNFIDFDIKDKFIYQGKIYNQLSELIKDSQILDIENEDLYLFSSEEIQKLIDNKLEKVLNCIKSQIELQKVLQF